MVDHKLSVGVLFGGRSGEHEVSLMSARSILRIIDQEKYNIIEIGITHEGEWYSGQDVLTALEKGKTEALFPVILLPEPGEHWLYAVRKDGNREILEPTHKLDLIFPVLHGSFGEDGAPQGLFEMANIAYVGAGVLGSSVGMDKALFKDVMRSHQIPVVDSITVNRRQIQANLNLVVQQAEEIADYPLFTKPANLGSSVGITRCRNRADLVEGLLEAARFDRRILIERGVRSPREIEVSVLGNDDPDASMPGEIIPSDEFYTYNAKYLDGKSALMIPAPLPDDMVRRIQSIAIAAFKACDCAGMARVDFLLEKDTQELYLNELNTIPGFTQISMYPKLWEASGLSYGALIDRLIELALERKQDNDHTERRYRSDE
jgi:D-alanine-D-alanine ligase